VVLAGCQRTSERARDDHEMTAPHGALTSTLPTPATPATSTVEVREYDARLAHELESLDMQISVLEAEVESSPGATIEERRAVLEDIKRRRDTLSADLAALRVAPEDGWPELRSRIDRDLSEMHGTLRRASRRTVDTPR
jgi:hypothetical protein